MSDYCSLFAWWHSNSVYGGNSSLAVLSVARNKEIYTAMPSNGASDMTGDSSDSLVIFYPTILFSPIPDIPHSHTPHTILRHISSPIQSSPVPQPQWRSAWNPGRTAKEMSTGRTVVNPTHYHGYHGYLPNLPTIDTLQRKSTVAFAYFSLSLLLSFKKSLNIGDIRLPRFFRPWK